ncbi:ribosome-recycling factor [Elysia marginata]|uniref:Ribosome-recycling factor n=1 Tax=Elysia marginata TaxID=1093978 RepID=A0AAV4HNA1_9GAST|nr:ribosome-recycling factor [Elysia marginata]
MEEARKKPKPYEVQYLDHAFFKDFSTTCTLKSIRPGVKPGDPVVVDIKALRYEPEGGLLYNLCFSSKWKAIPMKQGKSTHTKNAPSPLHSARLPIAASKYRHLQELKPYIRADFHAFYDALPHD